MIIIRKNDETFFHFWILYTTIKICRINISQNLIVSLNLIFENSRGTITFLTGGGTFKEKKTNNVVYYAS